MRIQLPVASAAAGNWILINYAEKDRVLENSLEVGSLLKVLSFEYNASSHGHCYLGNFTGFVGNS